MNRAIRTNQNKTTLLFNLLLAFCNQVKMSDKQTEKPIKYGSNHGKYATIHNTKIYYEEYGPGVPLLLLHQGLGSIENLAGIIPERSKHFRVIAPDATGHGRSEHADSLSGELLADYNSIKPDFALL